jgi:hypothetical protein
LIGVTLVGISLLILVGLVLARLSGVTTLGAWGVAAIYTALVTAVSGVSIFALGVTFNYLVSIFHKKPMRQGLFKKPVFKKPLNRHFGWMGLAGIVVGLLVGLVSLGLAVGGSWPVERLWFYLLFGAMAFLVGGQLFIYWILLQVLEELSKRETQVERDLQGYGPQAE